MLEQILDYIHNYFVKEIISGDFVIEDGAINGVNLLCGQYFKIVGSILNDGVYRYPADSLIDEQFTGEIWAMAVPPAVIALSDEVGEWVAKYEDTVNSPYTSESFGGYSYTKGRGTSGGGSDSADWRSIFGSRLNKWRKIS